MSGRMIRFAAEKLDIEAALKKEGLCLKVAEIRFTSGAYNKLRSELGLANDEKLTEHQNTLVIIDDTIPSDIAYLVCVAKSKC